ncbi:MAG: sugar ABC transporter ATP-binding protein [Fimbriimonadaceae bacterium]|nr:sugar ABC transporter ATP-binding protein [Fimbriimonadaceae bacterium]
MSRLPASSASPTAAPPLVAAVGVRRAYPGVQALAGVDFAVAAGEVHALVGENGAGKSTLIRLLTGAEQPDQGHLTLHGTVVSGLTPDTARAAGIAVIYQQPTLFGSLTVAENLALGLEPTGLWRRVDPRARRARARELLARLDCDLDPDRSTSSLSMAEQQLVALARALGAQARVLILDEPTACLPDREAHRLLGLLRQLRTAGVGIVYITHRLDELAGRADRVTVLRDGRSVGCLPAAEAGPAELIRRMVGREVGLEYPPRDTAPGEVLLQVDHLTSAAGGLRASSLELRRGEILGLAGLVGAGRTELARTLFGLTPADGGRILVHGRPVSIRSPRDAVALGLAYLPEDRRRHGVVGALSCLANITLASLATFTRRGLLQPVAELQAAAPFGERLAIRTPSWHTPVGSLSGGNQQKVALARWLLREPDLIIVDEPTQGIDVGAKAEIHRLLSDLAAAGKAVLLIASELPEVLGLSDRVAVMAGGRIVATLDRAAATPERVLALALGQEVPACGSS